MKKTHIYLFASFLVLLAGCEITDSSSPDPQDTFVKYYGVDGTQVGVDLAYDESSGNLIILGSLIPSGETERDVVIRRVDAAGNEVGTEAVLDFSSTTAGAANNGGDDEPGAIVVEDDGGFLLVGTSSRDLEGGGNPYSVIFVAELDENFNVLDSMFIERVTVDNSGDTTEVFDLRGLDVIRDRRSDELGGTLLVTGSSNFEEENDFVRTNSDEETQIFIARISLDQDSVYWARTQGFTGDDEAIYIDQFANDNFVLIGSSDKERGSEGKNVILLPINDIASPNDGLAEGFDVIDANGAVSRAFDEVATAVFKRPNGYIVTGTTSNSGTEHPFFINFTYTSAEAVNLDLGKAVNIGSEAGNGFGITLGRNGNYFMVGQYLDFGEKNGEVLVTQIDQSGNEIDGSLRNYGLEAGDDIGEDVLILPGGDVAVLSTVDFGGGRTLISLMRLNQDGDIMQ